MGSRTQSGEGGMMIIYALKKGKLYREMWKDHTGETPIYNKDLWKARFFRHKRNALEVKGYFERVVRCELKQVALKAAKKG